MRFRAYRITERHQPAFLYGNAKYMPHKDYIEALRTLGLDPSATEEEIRQTYRSLIKQLHPDRSYFVDTDLFLRIRQAYECCRTRFEHSQVVVTDHDRTDTTADSYRHNTSDNLQNGTYLFLTVSAQDALNGTSKEMWVMNREDFCPRCKGTGFAPKGENESICPRCNGNGYVPIQWGDERMLLVCSTCSGTGSIGKTTCNLCKGRGRITIKRPLRVHLPRGIRNGTVLKIPGQGAWQARRYSRDAVFVEVRVEFPENWSLQGHDLHASIHIDIWTALKGGMVPFQTLEGRWIQVNCPACTMQNGNNPIVIPGHGWVNECGGRGNLILTQRLIFPSSPPSETVRSMLELLQRLWPINTPLSLPSTQ